MCQVVSQGQADLTHCRGRSVWHSQLVPGLGACLGLCSSYLTSRLKYRAENNNSYFINVSRTWWGQLIFAPCRESSESWLTCLVAGAGCGLGPQLEPSAETPTRGCPCACLSLSSEVAGFQQLSRERESGSCQFLTPRPRR